MRKTMQWIADQRWNEDADLDDICTRAERELAAQPPATPVTDGSIQEGDILSYEMTDGVGKVTSHVRPPAAPVETDVDLDGAKALALENAILREEVERLRHDIERHIQIAAAEAQRADLYANSRPLSVPDSSAGNEGELPERLRWEALESSGHNKRARKVLLEAAAEIEALRHDLDRHIQIATDIANEPQTVNNFAVNKLEEMRHLAEYLETYRLSDPHIGPDDCDLIVAALNTCAVTRPNRGSGE